MPLYRICDLVLPQSETIPALWWFCVGQISQKIGFKDLTAFSLLASLYVVSHGRQYAEEWYLVTLLRLNSQDIF